MNCIKKLMKKMILDMYSPRKICKEVDFFNKEFLKK